MVLRETSSPLINVMVQVICDPRANLDVTAQAADLISLCARLNRTVADAKRYGSPRSREYFEQLRLAYMAVSNAVARVWTGRGDEAEMAEVVDAINAGIASLRGALAAEKRRALRARQVLARRRADSPGHRPAWWPLHDS